jgi:hypothetical protein
VQRVVFNCVKCLLGNKKGLGQRAIRFFLSLMLHLATRHAITRNVARRAGAIVKKEPYACLVAFHWALASTHVSPSGVSNASCCHHPAWLPTSSSPIQGFLKPRPTPACSAIAGIYWPKGIIAGRMGYNGLARAIHSSARRANLRRWLAVT